MPPAEPLEEQIEAAMATQLQTIAASDRYWTTPKVTRSLLRIDQYEGAAEADLVRGILGVMRSSGSTLQIINRDGDLEHFHRVAIWGYVIGDAAVPAGTRLNRLWADHVRCLLAPDVVLPSPILDIRPDPEMPRDTDDGAREPRAFFREHWLVTATETLE